MSDNGSSLNPSEGDISKCFTAVEGSCEACALRLPPSAGLRIRNHAFNPNNREKALVLEYLK